MPGFPGNEPLYLSQQEGDVFSSEGSSYRRHASPECLQNFAFESTYHEIVEAHMDDEINEEEEAAFCAEAEAFARKCDVHELAVRRLVQDMVEDDELEASNKMHNASVSDEMGSVTFTSASIVEAPEQENDSDSHARNGKDGAVSTANSPHESMEKGELGSPSITVNGTQNDKHRQQQANKRSGINQNGKNSHQLEYPSSKKRIQPMKERAQDKAPSQSPSKTLAAAKPIRSPNSSSTRKLTTEPNKVRSSTFLASKKLTQEEGKGQCESESGRVQTKVKEFLHTRKPADNKRALRDNESDASGERNSSTVGSENPDLGPFLLKL
eukprot:c19211_g1_i1 orf=486-1460(+)